MFALIRWYERAITGRIGKVSEVVYGGAYVHTDGVAGAVRQGERAGGDPAVDPERVNARRLELLLAEAATAAHPEGVLVIDDSGDRKDGKATAHAGRQWLGRLGKTANGIVTVSTLLRPAALGRAGLQTGQGRARPGRLPGPLRPRHPPPPEAGALRVQLLLDHLVQQLNRRTRPTWAGV
ncbi:transposase [[Actinomadura] parvosata]|uniref:transposase n=1 Tax=[Actinomadura] parvosata TaxID=1955412 RepID=UPI00406D4828